MLQFQDRKKELAYTENLWLGSCWFRNFLKWQFVASQAPLKIRRVGRIHELTLLE